MAVGERVLAGGKGWHVGRSLKNAGELFCLMQSYLSDPLAVDSKGALDYLKGDFALDFGKR